MFAGKRLTVVEHQTASPGDVNAFNDADGGTVASRLFEVPGPLRSQLDRPLTVPGYTLTREIGTGGMASIFLAERHKDGRPLVLKILPFKAQENPVPFKRFMREYNLLKKLCHPHVARVFERGFGSDLAYIAMEYFPAGDLKTRIKHGINPATAMNFLRQIALGLDAVHRIGVIHRDLKPANILFRDEQCLAITDFGIAKDTNASGDLTSANSLLGTAYFISPELITRQGLDKRSDLYSLGVILYQMLTGILPYRGTTPYEVFQAHLETAIPSLPSATSRYQFLLNTLLAKNPNDRFQNVAELLDGLDRVT
ncbi:MAG: serine/threonine-protein kinase [Gammaproteobacteria bacterium]